MKKILKYGAVILAIGGLVIASIIWFTHREKPAIAASWHGFTAAVGSNDFRAAYNYLTPEAKQRWAFEAFTNCGVCVRTFGVERGLIRRIVAYPIWNHAVVISSTADLLPVPFSWQGGFEAFEGQFEKHGGRWQLGEIPMFHMR